MAKKKQKEQVVDEPILEKEPVVEKEAEVVSSDNGTAKEVEVTSAEAPNLEQQLEQAQQEAAQNLDRWQRAAAELANYKRRQEEQLKLQRDMIKADVLQGVISALDDMDLAFQNVPPQLDGQLVGWVEGFRLVQRKLDKILEDQGVSSISTAGAFDPNLHEAVSHEDSPDHEEGQIIAELRKGYQIGSRVIRPALVRVAK
ncbi:MAG: nucleotide exchange factor GrpE [Anaerolineales bacterium]|nr:nucleotide exchange factor GrpE [Anaerolineales bacterium]